LTAKWIGPIGRIRKRSDAHAAIEQPPGNVFPGVSIGACHHMQFIFNHPQPLLGSLFVGRPIIDNVRHFSYKTSWSSALLFS
jgi:hypothetical protein